MAIYSRYLREIRAGLFGVGCRRGAFLHEIDGYERLRGARLPAVKVLLHARCSDLGFFKRLLGMCLIRTP